MPLVGLPNRIRGLDLLINRELMLQIILIVFATILCGAVSAQRGYPIALGAVIGAFASLIGTLAGLGGSTAASAITLFILYALPRRGGQECSCSICQTTVFTDAAGRCPMCGTFLATEKDETDA